MGNTDWSQARIRFGVVSLVRQDSQPLNAPGARPVPEDQLTPEEAAWVHAVTAYRQNELDYFNEQQHKPQTLCSITRWVRQRGSWKNSRFGAIPATLWTRR